ncbi:MAG: AAA family ATPase [Candidatus Hydrogenedentes bacterium]|nr:AAA family ATPase [Candidatus Hydrogenedentota bacterium]
MTTEYSTEFSAGGSDAPAAAVQPRTINIKRLLRLRAKLMIVVFLALAIPGSIAAWLLSPVKYQATAILRFASSRPTLSSTESNSRGTNYDKYLETQVRLIAGPTIQARVLNDAGIRHLPLIDKADDQLAFLSKYVLARNQAGSELVTVSCKLTDPNAAYLIVQQTVKEYIDYDAQQTTETGGWIRKTLSDSVQSRDIELRQYNDVISTLRKKLDMPESSVGTELGLSETMSFNENLARAQADQTTADKDVERVKNLLAQVEELQVQYKSTPDAAIFAQGIEDRVIADMNVASLRSQITRQEGELAEKGNILQADAPQLKVMKHQLESLKSKLVQTQREVRGEMLQSVKAKYTVELAAAEKIAEGAKQRASDFAGRIADHKKERSEAAAIESQIKELLEKREETKKMRDRMQGQIDQIDMDRTAPAAVTVASQASKPTRPDFGTRFQFIIMAVMGSLGAALGAGLLRELTDQQLRSGQDIAYVTNLPILATVPHVSADQLPSNTHTPLLTADHPASTTADEYRRILTRIIYPPEGSAELNTCLVVSPSRGDGKTALASNLAVSLAQANRRVLLVDISVRHPSIEHSFGLAPAEGLGEVLCSKHNFMELVRATEFPNLFVLGPGLRGSELIGKLASRDIVEFLEHAEETFEHVIIDTPPSLIMSDARLLAPIVDGVIAVAGVGVSTIGMLKRCLTELQQGGANVIGVVLNGIRPTRGGYLSRNMEQYYAYSEGRDGAQLDTELPEMAVLDEEYGEEHIPPAILIVDDAHSEQKQAGGSAP